MSRTIPIFPLELVVFPGESLNLHIFEPRYKQLINECDETQTPFGIPSVVNKKISGFGTLVELVKITRRHEDGRMDIKTRGLEIFCIVQIMKMVPGKLYSGADVEMLKNDLSGDEDLMRQVVDKLKKLLKLAGLARQFGKPDAELKSYDVAHHVGLSLKKEYELLGILEEVKRQDYLNHHLAEILPMVSEIESLKKKIQLNGEFRPLPGFDL